MSFAVTSLSSCEIFPEIAGIVSASDSEVDVMEYLLHGKDGSHTAGDFVFSPPCPKVRQNSEKNSEDEATIREMLDTLCYTVHDLTHINYGIVDNVVLDWRNGTADLESDGLTTNKVIVKTEQSCENADINSTSNETLVNGYIAALPEGNFCIKIHCNLV